MGFPSTFYCVCASPDCRWNRPLCQEFGRGVTAVGEDGVCQASDPDDRPTRIAGSSYWNTCPYFPVIVFEAVFIRTLRNLVCERVIWLKDLPEVLDHLLRARRYDKQFLRRHAHAIRRIVDDLSFLERRLGTMNGHLIEMARLARHLVIRNQALLDVLCEPHYWPTREEALAVIYPARGRASAGKQVA